MTTPICVRLEGPLPDAGWNWALLNRMQQEAHAAGCDTVLLVPSWMALDFYTRFGYTTVLEYAVCERAG
ncbi:MAG: hypothetical protein GYB64_01510 [Chloroflexi bacterium]|nr:hypothetical protein [Chloroflexota bacterium]